MKLDVVQHWLGESQRALRRLHESTEQLHRQAIRRGVLSKEETARIVALSFTADNTIHELEDLYRRLENAVLP